MENIYQQLLEHIQRKYPNTSENEHHEMVVALIELAARILELPNPENVVQTVLTENEMHDTIKSNQ